MCFRVICSVLKEKKAFLRVLTPNYTVEELDDLYGTNIKDLSFTYKKEHHYSLLTHKKTEYVF